MALFGGEIDRSALELKRTREQLARVDEKLLAAERELATLRASLPTAELTEISGGDSAAPMRARISDLQLHVSGLTAGRQTARQQIVEAIKERLRARAGVIRREATKVQRELDKHVAERGRLLAALVAHEGCPYVADLTPAGREEVIIGARHVVVVNGTPPPARSVQLQAQIDRLLNEARAIEQRRISLGGQINGGNLEELLKAAHAEELVPPGDSVIRAWYETAFAQLEQEWAHIVAHDLPEARRASGIRLRGDEPAPVPTRSFTFAWDQLGQVDLKGCKAQQALYQRAYGKPAALPAPSLAPEAA